MVELGDDNMCFLCGSDNPFSPELKFEYDEETGQACAEFTPGEHFAGYENVMHGGIVTALLDEAMAKAISNQGWQAVTAEIKVRFLEPVKLDRPVVVRGIIQERRRRVIEASARLEGRMGQELARGKARFLMVGNNKQRSKRRSVSNETD